MFFPVILVLKDVILFSKIFYVFGVGHVKSIIFWSESRGNVVKKAKGSL